MPSVGSRWPYRAEARPSSVSTMRITRCFMPAPSRSRSRRGPCSFATFGLANSPSTFASGQPTTRGVMRIPARCAFPILSDAAKPKVGDRTEVQSDKPAGQIVKQLPDANAEVEPGSAIAIEVAARSDRVVPHLIGLHIAEAKAVLDQSGVGAALGFRADPRRAGIVL